MLLPFKAEGQSTEPELELWPGPVRAGALAAPILSVSPSFSTIPNPNSAIINGITFWLPVGSIIASSSTGFLRLDAGRNWVPLSATGDTSGIIGSSTSVISWMVRFATDVRDITKVVFSTETRTFSHYFPANYRRRPVDWFALTIGGAPYQESAHIIAASGGAHLGIRVALTDGKAWEPGQVAEGEFWIRPFVPWIAPPKSILPAYLSNPGFKPLSLRWQ